MKSSQLGLATMLLLSVAACSRGVQSESAASAVGAAPMMDKVTRGQEPSGAAGAMLAYEHTAEVAIDAATIPQRLQAARSACDAGRFGTCVVLNVQQSGGDYPSATLGMRLVPAAVEPMIALASAGARLGSRSTRAEDLAVVVRDNALLQERLRKEMARLQEFQQRRDLAVADMIALSRQLAETEAQLQSSEQEGAQHRRRIDTQLLTLGFHPPGGESGRNEIAQALRDSGKVLSMGAAWTIRAVAFLVPLLFLLGFVVLGIRRRRRRKA